MTGLAAPGDPVTLIARGTAAEEGPGSVVTDGLRVTVVETESTLVDIGTLGVLPGVGRLAGVLGGAGPVAPATAQGLETGGAGGVLGAALALLGHCLARLGDVGPVLTAAELELAGVDGEEEAGL